MDRLSKQVICTSYAPGKCHDFRLFQAAKTAIHPDTRSITDSAYQGIQKCHKKADLPQKSSKNRPTTLKERQHNGIIARERVVNENVIGMIKRFKIIADRYRNRRKRFALRFNLIAAIYNLELDS